MRFIYRFEAMTTPCEVVIFENDERKANECATLILKEAKRLEKKYNYFDKNSYLSAINERKIKAIDPETKNLIKKSLHYYEQTEGVFDITIGTVKDIFKSSETIEELLKRKSLLMPFVGCEHIKIKKNEILFDNPHTKIDLGGIVKEYAVDKAVKILKKKRISSAIVNFGGDIFVLGKKPNGEKFKVGIKDPQNPQTFKTFVELENRAVATSASYERSSIIEDKKFSHIISKSDLAKPPLSVSVISPSCMESGVFSTALMIDPSIPVKYETIIL